MTSTRSGRGTRIGLIAFIASLAALLVPMRVDNQAERDGLDLTSHGERAYEFD